MKDTLQVTEMIFGQAIPVKLFLIYIIFSIIGLVFSLLLEVYKAGIKPETFDWGYYWKRNRFRILLNIITMTLGVLFTEDLLGIELNVYSSLLAGFTSDKVLETLKTKHKK